mmetsp:Transcript_12808/g.23972  ORF Transcript_12808/g.23972 Transcript_12808/m.23972 type:complete len:141 (+) Transcript_12808:73-495(+)
MKGEMIRGFCLLALVWLTAAQDPMMRREQTKDVERHEPLKTEGLESLLEDEEEAIVHVDKMKRGKKLGYEPGGTFIACNTTGVPGIAGGETCSSNPTQTLTCTCHRILSPDPSDTEQTCCIEVPIPDSESPKCDWYCIPA